MTEPWDLSPPDPSELGDKDVIRFGDQLQGKKVALMVTGGIAAMKSPFIARVLRGYGADVTAFVTESALEYVTPTALAWCTNNPVIDHLSADAEHLNFYDIYLVAPATYNIINKIRYGVADDVVTTAILPGFTRDKSKIIMVPTMHGDMHNSILTESLRKLSDLGICIMKPRQDNGKNNMPDEKYLVREVIRAVSDSPLRGKSILVTGGNTPVKIDDVRRIVNKFKGTLGIEIAEELYRCGANVTLIHSDSRYKPPADMNFIPIGSHVEYRETVHSHLKSTPCDAAIFSAAVADYAPQHCVSGKIPSGEGGLMLRLVQTPKVIKEVREGNPNLFMVTFKYEEDLAKRPLIDLAASRIERDKYQVVVANSGKVFRDTGEHVAYLVSGPNHSYSGISSLEIHGKRSIATSIARYLEGVSAAGGLL